MSKIDDHKFYDAFEEVIISSMELHLNFDLEKIPQQDLQQSFQRLVSFYQLGSQIFSETDENKVFETILSAVSTLLNIERAFIAVFSNGRLVPHATYNISLEEKIESWPISTTMLKRVLDEGISILTTDALRDEQFGKAPSVDLHSIRSVICCPLGLHHNRRGLIYADNRVSTNAFTPADLKFLNALSHYALLAINNSEERQSILNEKNLAEARLDDLRNEFLREYEIVGVSNQLVQLYSKVKKIAQKDVPVLILGETGTGKELFAKFIHKNSTRVNGPFVAVNVAGLPDNLADSELFGHEKGAFTGAEKRRIGKFELAKGGTLFLDEVLDIPLNIQVKLLRVLEEYTFERLGSNETIHADIRIICASNKNPENLVAKQLFREDLYYRINSTVMEIAPLRNRREDIPFLINHFLKQCNSDKIISEQALNCLTNYDWPGNVRELRSTITSLSALIDGKTINKSDLPLRMQKSIRSLLGTYHNFESLSEIVARVEKEHFEKALEITKGNNKEAIKLLNISRAKFFQRKKEFGL